jgi:lysyl endopeptidase
MPRHIHGIHGLMCAVLIALLVVAPNRAAQAARPPQLAQGAQPLEQVAEMTLPALEVERLREEAKDQAAGAPARFGEVAALRITPMNSGTTETLADGSLLWRIRISAPRALSLSFGFGRYAMSPGGRLAVYTPDYTTILGSYTAADNASHGQLWTPILPGSAAVVELHAPAAEWDSITLELTAAARAFTGFGLPRGAAPESAACNIDVICPEGELWQPEVRAVAVYSFVKNNNIYFCSGALINNTAQDHKPYFLTANHCVSTAEMAASVVTYWNYQSLVCRSGQASNGGPGGQLPDSALTGATLRATYAPSDFSLLELDDAVPRSFAPHWAGWDKRDRATSSSVTIHHPQGHEKRISIDTDPTTITSLNDPTSPGDGTHLRVADWDSGTTEVGSSGAPLFNPDHLIVGQLHGGLAACGNNSADYYGRLAISWSGGGDPTSRLSDWLDPSGLGVTTLGGIDTDPDFALKVSPDRLAICAPAPATLDISLLTTLGYNETVKLSALGYPTGASLSFSKSSVPTPGSATLTLGTTNATPGNYLLRVVGSTPTLVHTGTVAINLASARPASTRLLSPTESAHSQLVQPTLFWQASSGANSYRVEISSGSGFTTMAYSATTALASHHVASELQPGSRYYWRVVAANGCGETVSQTGTFTTRLSPEECSPQITATNLFTTTFENGSLGWTAGVSDTWSLTSDSPHSGGQAYHAEDLPMVADQRLVTPLIRLPQAEGLTLQFWHLRDMEPNQENCFDGGVLEISPDGGRTWIMIPTERLLRDPYDGGLSESYDNPLGSYPAWCGKRDWSRVVVDLSGYSGQTVKFRFRLASDKSNGRPGWTIDDVQVQACGWTAHKLFLGAIFR